MPGRFNRVRASPGSARSALRAARGQQRRATRLPQHPGPDLRDPGGLQPSAQCPFFGYLRLTTTCAFF